MTFAQNDDGFMFNCKYRVVQKGMRKRNIYLPKIPKESSKDAESAWVRGSDGTLFSGGSWVNETQVPLEEVPYFVRLSDPHQKHFP